MKKSLPYLFLLCALMLTTMSAWAGEVATLTPRTPVVPWGAQAEIIITNDLTEQYGDGIWHLTADAQRWIEYSYDGTTEGGTIQQTNRPNVWFDIYDETTDTMIVTGAEKDWGGYLTVKSKAGNTDGLMVVGKNRYPTFYVIGTDRAKFYFSGSAGTIGYPRIEVYEVGNETPVATYTGDYGLTKKTWDRSTLLIADGLDKAKSYKIVARTMALVNGSYTYEGGDIVLQVIKFYGDQAPMREDGLIISGSEIGSYINQHLAVYPEVTDFTLEAGGKYTIAEGITALGKFTLTGVASHPATIDASALAAPFVQFATIAEDAEKDENGFVAATNVKFANIKVNALGQTLFSSNKQNYLIPELTIDNSLITLTGNPFVIDFRGGGLFAKLAVSNSTIWAAEATTNSFYTGMGGKKATEAGLKEQVFSITNSTLSNIAVDKNFCTHRQSGQTWLTYEVKNSIIANCGKENFLVSLNQGMSSVNPKYVVEGITVLKTVQVGTQTEMLANINNQQSTIDDTEEIVNPIDGVPFTLADALAGNFKLIASSQQAKYMTGDPRWLTPYATDAIKIEVDQYENTDFAAVLNEALLITEQPSSITIQFYEAGEYPLTQPINTTSPITIQNGSDIEAGEATIVVNHGMTLGGAIKIDGVNLKAGDELTEPIITLQGNPYKMQENGFYNLGKIQLLNLTVSNLKSDLIYGNHVRNIISEIETKNCQIYMAAEKKTVYNFTGGGVVGTFSILNSTLDAAGSYIYSSQSGQKATEAGLTQQTFKITNSTIYHTAKAFLHRQVGQRWMRYILKNSMIVNPNKDNFVADMNGGMQSSNPTWEISGNAFQRIEDGVATDLADLQNNGDSDEPVVNSVLGTMVFNSLETPDFGGTFTLEEGQETPTSLGDPRWSISFIYGEIVPVVGRLEIAGERVTDANAADILGDGTFSYNAKTKTLHIKKSYEYDDFYLIHNWDIDGLTVAVDNDVTLTCPNTPDFAMWFWVPTTITGPGKLTLYGNISIIDGNTLTIENADLELQLCSSRSIYGNLGGEKLIVRNSNIHAKSYYRAICDFTGGITLEDCILADGCAISEDGDYIVNADGSEAKEVTISKIDDDAIKDVLGTQKDNYFTLDGGKLQSAPSQHGIYINGGKKVLMK